MYRIKCFLQINLEHVGSVSHDAGDNAHSPMSLTSASLPKGPADGVDEMIELNPVTTQVNALSTYASLVDPEEGSELKFFPTSMVNGVRCAKLEKKDVESEIEYWQQAVLCSVLGANPPFEIIQGFIKRIWAKFEIDKIVMVRKGVLLVRFGNIQDQIEVVRKGIYFFDSKPFIVRSWNPDMDLHTDKISSLPLWIQLPALDVKYWGADSLGKIGSLIGIPLKTDRFTKDRTMLSYARLLIDIQLDSSFPEFIDFFNDNDVLVRQEVFYEWKPVKCDFCHMLGHEEKVCRKKKSAPRQVWMRIPAQPSNASHPDPAPQVDAEGFTTVTKRHTGGTMPQVAATLPSTPLSNTFNLLQENMVSPPEHGVLIANG